MCRSIFSEPDSNSFMTPEDRRAEDSDEPIDQEDRNAPVSTEQDDLLSPEKRPKISSIVAAQRAIFSDPVPKRPARDIAGRAWHGRPPAYWSTCCTP
jgi:hypothetical protein